MNDMTRIEPPDASAVAIDLTRIMRDQGILRIGRYSDTDDLDSFAVYMTGNRYGGGKTVGEALANARGRA